MPAAVPLGAAAIGGAASLGSAIIGAGAANKAGQQQYNATENALATQQLWYKYAQNQLDPFIQTGQGAMSQLGALYGIGNNGGMPDFSRFTNSPDFAFASQQGNLGVQRALAAAGATGSGGAVKAASDYNMGLATQQFGNYFNRLSSIAGMGLQGATVGAGLAGNAASTLGGTQMAAGANLASGTIGSANSWMNGIQGIGSSAFAGASLYSNMQNSLAIQQLLSRNPSAYQVSQSPSVASAPTGWPIAPSNPWS